MHYVEQRENATIIHVNGELDVVSAPALAAIIRLAQSEQAQRVIVSLERCGYCYSAGISVLARAQKSLGETLFVVVPAKSPFRRVFDVTGLAQVLQIVPTMQRALDAKYDAKLQPGFSSAAGQKHARLKLELLSSRA